MRARGPPHGRRAGTVTVTRQRGCGGRTEHTWPLGHTVLRKALYHAGGRVGVKKQRSISARARVVVVNARPLLARRAIPVASGARLLWTLSISLDSSNYTFEVRSRDGMLCVASGVVVLAARS